MINTIYLLLRQPEAQSVLTSISLFGILVLSHYSFIIPSSVWDVVFSNNVSLLLYCSLVIFIMRWFGRGGQFTAIHKMNLDGQTFLVTGAAGGIGKETCLELAKKGARVILFARSNNLTQAVDDVKKVARSQNHVTGYAIDLSDLASIKNCVEQFLKHEDK